jgi:hypothetical protein
VVGAQRRFTGLLDTWRRCCYLEIIIISTPTRPAEFVPIPLGVERPAPSI